MARQRALDFGKTELSNDQEGGIAISSQANPEDVKGVSSSNASVEAELKPRGFFADQFEVGLDSSSACIRTLMQVAQNRSNFDAHFNGTGPEIWRQTNGEIDAFVSGAGAMLSLGSQHHSD